MNLICGIVDFSKSINVVETGNKMVEAFSGYPGDKVNCWHNDWCYVYCHHQHITPESVKDTLPFYDADSGLVITASAIVDNRKELLDLLGIKDSHLNEISDSQLILKAYKKWGEDCSKHIIGDYCFAIIDIRDKKVVCSRDHTGKICFYYTGGSSYFAFSSIIKPFFSIPGLKKSFNNQWIADFLAIPTVIHELDASLTVYRDIYEVLPAETLAVTPEKTTKTIYWNPLMLPQIKFKKDEEYDEAFREIFFEAVRCRTRSIGNVGIMLSGGLDSGSVASVAAMQMEAEGRRLKAYSAVPFDGYREHLGDGFISDESNYINEIAGKYSNIDIAYNKAEGKNSFTDIRQFIDIIEQPYKTV
ncbi:MAG: asparagine synthase-related protein, partial [Clostridia bacterium]|nr:asparagine synthase-related protein [Clostridia bacterium]